MEPETEGQTDKDLEQRKVNIAISFSNKEVMRKTLQVRCSKVDSTDLNIQ